MRVGVLLIALVLALSPNVALAKNETLTIGPKPAWAQLSEALPVPVDFRGPIFVRRNNFQVHLSKSSQLTFVGSLIRLLDTNALALGNISISWNPAAGMPIVHAVRVHRGDAVRDVLVESKFEVLRREGQLETAMLDGVLTAVLRVPDLRVGDELELSYSVPSHDPTLRTSSYGFMYLTGTPAPGRVGFRLSWEPGEEPLIRQTPDFADLLSRDAQSVAATFDNAAALTPPKDAPPRYLWQRALEFSDFADWPALSRRMLPLYEAAAALPPTSAVRTEASTIAAAHSAPLDRVAAALQLVQQQVRYVYVGLNGGNLTPANAEETWLRRYGDCKGKTALLLALLKELGIEAEAVLVNNSGGDDGIDARLPSPGMFNHVLVRAKVDGTAYWLDGTLPHVYRPSISAVLPYRWVLPISTAGSALEQIVWKPDTQPSLTQIVDIDARQGFTVPAKLVSTIIKRGPAALVDQIQLSSVTDSQLEASIREGLDGDDFWTTVDKVTWRFDSAEQASVMQITGTGPVDWSNATGRSRFLVLPGGGFRPPGRRARGSSQDASAPYYIEPEFDCHVTTLRLPVGTAEKDWSYNTRFDRVLFGQSFRRSFERRGGAIRMISSNRTLQTELDSAAAARDNAQIADFDNSAAQVFYDPNSYDSIKPFEIVPAADEVDWVKDPSACLVVRPVEK